MKKKFFSVFALLLIIPALAFGFDDYGSQWKRDGDYIYPGGERNIWAKDDTGIYLGTDKDYQIVYNSTTGKLEWKDPDGNVAVSLLDNGTDFTQYINGNVLIGTMTSSGAKLEVQGGDLRVGLGGSGGGFTASTTGNASAYALAVYRSSSTFTSPDIYDANGYGVAIAASGSSQGIAIDGDTTAGNTRFLLYDVDSGTLKRVSVGAADSGGAGYKVLRIPN